ncbi:MAG: exodeoxyribonuclease VII small subunit [Victivallales bacterium]|jgi:exodeoxyribonuclease VII small subunit|nr:exodeoxyribonuclease VII small subunit [Victivallales bacterium]
MSECTRTELDAMPFEQALQELEALVNKMETGRLPLEELMKSFEAGSELAKVCRAKLDKLERKIELLTRDDGDKGEWTDFEADVPSPVRNAPESSSNSPTEELPF